MRTVIAYTGRFICMVVAIVLVMNIVTATVFADDKNAVCAEGMSKLDCDAILNNWVNWIPKDDSDTTCSNSVGSNPANNGNNPQTVYAFFRGAGLSDMHAAAVYGNLFQESGMDPTIMEKGGNSNNPADADIVSKHFTDNANIIPLS